MRFHIYEESKMRLKTLPSLALRLAAIAALSLYLAGCPSTAGDPPKDPSAISALATGQVYTAGYTAGLVRAVYWEGATARTIADADLGTATKAACVVPTNLGVYVVGAKTDQIGSDYVERAVIWFNGIGAYLDDRPSFALTAILHDGKIMAAGWRESEDSSTRPCWWEISDTWTMGEGSYAVATRSIERHDLPSDMGGEARDIAASGSEVYVCGRYYSGSHKACLWTNDVRSDLVGGNNAEALCVSGGSLYVGGSSAAGACYWVNGEGSNLSGFPAGSSDCIVTAIAVGSGGVVLGGTYYRNSNDSGFQSVSGTLTTALPCVIGAAALGSDVYIGCEDGWLKNGSYTELPWIDGRRPRGIKMRIY